MALTIICGQKANLGASVSYNFYMSIIGGDKRKVEISDVLKKEKELASLLKMYFLTACLPLWKKLTFHSTKDKK